MQVSAALLPILLLPCSCPPRLLLFVLHCALFSRVLWTRAGTWLKAQTTSPLYCPAHSSRQRWRLSCVEKGEGGGGLCCQPVTSAGALQWKAGASQPAGSRRFVSAVHPLMCSFHQMETAAKENAENHLKNKNIPLQLVKDKLQFQW